MSNRIELQGLPFEDLEIAWLCIGRGVHRHTKYIVVNVLKFHIPKFLMKCLSIFSFPGNNLSKYHQRVCALILWKSGLGLLMGNLRQFLTELSARKTSVFLFKGNNLSKSLWIFTKLSDILIWKDMIWTWKNWSFQLIQLFLVRIRL